MATFVLTYNPSKWEWGRDRQSMARRTAAGRSVRGRWSLGGRKSGITPGQDRVFLLRQGPEPRGIIASGTFASDPFVEPHWDVDKPGQDAVYAEILWDLVLTDDDLLPFADVEAGVTGLQWNRIQAGGVTLPPPGDEALERLWAAHTGRDSGTALPPGARRGQAWQSDPVRRKAVEDHGQRLLEDHFARDGWTVKDTRYGHPYDAIATKDGQTRYLEAKGTETDGLSVRVTSGEVTFALAHRDECVMGIVSNIRFKADGTLDSESGTLTIHPWDPDQGTLTAKVYDWTPEGR